MGGTLFFQFRKHGLGHDFAQGNHHEIALRHVRMGHDELGSVEVQVVEQEDVDVDWAVGIAAINRFPLPSQLAFYLLGDAQNFPWSELCGNKHAGIEKLIVALETPRRSFDKAGRALHRAHTLTKEGDGALKKLPPVAQIGA